MLILSLKTELFRNTEKPNRHVSTYSFQPHLTDLLSRWSFGVQCASIYQGLQSQHLSIVSKRMASNMLLLALVLLAEPPQVVWSSWSVVGSESVPVWERSISTCHSHRKMHAVFFTVVSYSKCVEEVEQLIGLAQPVDFLQTILTGWTQPW